MIYMKYARLCMALIDAFFKVWFRFPRLSRNDRLRAIQSWSARVLTILRIEVQTTTPPTEHAPHALWVANHVSWLDILVIQSLQPCIFVAKREVKHWPLVGALAQACGVIFVDRSSASAAKEMVNDVATALQRGYCVAGFPEGTSSEGLQVQLFHANLFEAALFMDTPVQPLALRYVHAHNHTLCTQAAFIGELDFLTSLHQVMEQKNVIAKVKLEKRLPPAGHSRRTLAHLSHQYVSHALATMAH